MTELTLPDHDPLRTISNYPMNNPPHFAPTLQSHAATAMHAPPPAFPSPAHVPVLLCLHLFKHRGRPPVAMKSPGYDR